MSHAEPAIFRDSCNYCQRFELFDMINDALVLNDSQTGEILFMNKEALALYQYTLEECFKLSIGQISHDSETLIRENMVMAKQYTNGYVFTTNHIKKDGSIFKVEVSTRYITLHGTTIFASIVRNLTPFLKMREEVELAGKVQRRLLPYDLDNDLFQIHSIYQPYNYVSGDLYDFSFDEDKKILYGIVIDVMGHGIAATAHTGLLKYLFVQAKEKNISLQDKLRWINNEVMSFFADGGFAAVFLFEFDYTSKTLTYSAGGINHFIVMTGQGPKIIKAPGLFLGINADEAFDQGIMHFKSGESFLFLTDGLFELLPQSLPSTLNFESMQELCANLAISGNNHDDISAIGIVIR